MKFNILIIAIVVFTTFFTSCKKDDAEPIGNWVEKAFYEGYARANGSSFAIDNYGYWGMGKDADDFLLDFWKYDPVKNSWTQVADFPGTPRAYNVSIGNGKNGFVGLGYDGDNDLSDFWIYDAANNKWDELPEFGGGERRYATAFAINNDIYVGTGTKESNKVYTNDFWKFDGSNWAKITTLSGEKRRSANAIGYDGKGYLLSGYHNNSTLQDFWSYDPSANTWTKLTNLNNEDTGASDIARQNACTYAIDGKIYLVAGNISGVSTSTVYEYDLGTTEWITKTTLESSQRESAGSFILNDNAYIVGGRSGSSYMDDCYMFQPGIEKNSDD